MTTPNPSEHTAPIAATDAANDTPAGGALDAERAARVRSEERLAAALERAEALRARVDAVVADLEKREARTRQIINTSEDAFVETDIAGEITDWNTTAELLFGYTRDEVLGRLITTVCRPEGSAGDPEGGLPAILDALGEQRRGELIGVRKDGARIPIELCVGMLIDDDAFYFTAFAHDISHRRAEQAQRMRAQKLESIGQLAAGIAHEINTPTQYIRDNLEFLRDTFAEARPFVEASAALSTAASQEGTNAQITELARRAEDARQEADLDYALDETPRALSQALEGVQRVAEIVRAMKDFAHPGTGQYQPVDLNRAIESTTIVCRNEWKHAAALELDLDDSLPPVVCLPGELNQVVLNLVVNAAHAIESAGRAEAGRIVVRTRRAGDRVEIVVSDNGTGIAPEHRERVFDPFFTTKPVGRGTGQGLALVHSIVVEKHRGTVSLETTPGRGTAFTISIPLAPPSVGEHAEAA